jgi:hypothetical protein
MISSIEQNATVTDSKGTQIKVGSLIKVNGSKVVREVRSGNHDLEGLSVVDGLIQASRLDQGVNCFVAWVIPSKVTVISEAA